MEKKILLKEIENTNHLNELYQLWNEFKLILKINQVYWNLVNSLDLIIIFKKNSIN